MKKTLNNGNWKVEKEIKAIGNIQKAFNKQLFNKSTFHNLVCVACTNLCFMFDPNA